MQKMAAMTPTATSPLHPPNPRPGEKDLPWPNLLQESRVDLACTAGPVHHFSTQFSRTFSVQSIREPVEEAWLKVTITVPGRGTLALHNDL